MCPGSRKNGFLQAVRCMSELVPMYSGFLSHSDGTPTSRRFCSTISSSIRIHGHRVGAKEQRFRLPHELGVPGEGAAMVDRAKPVHDVEHGLRAQRGDAAHHGDDRVGVGLRIHVRAGDVVEGSVGEVLQAAGHTRGVVFLQTGQVDDLVGFGRDDAREIGAGLALPETVHLAEDIRIVSAASVSADATTASRARRRERRTGPARDTRSPRAGWSSGRRR